MYNYGYFHDYNLSPNSPYYTGGIRVGTLIRQAIDYLNSQSVAFIPVEELILRLRDFELGWLDYEAEPDGSLTVTAYRPLGKANQVKIQGRDGKQAIASGSSVVSQQVAGESTYVDLAPEDTSTFRVEFVATVPASPVVTAPAYACDSIDASWTMPAGVWRIADYQYALGTSPGTDDLLGWTSAGSATSCSITGLSIEHAMVCYVSVKAVSNYGLTSAAGASSPVLIDLLPPSVLSVNATLLNPEAIRASCVAVDADSGVAAFRFAIGSSPGLTDVMGWTTPSDEALREFSELQLEAGHNYYVLAQAKDNAGVWSAPLAGNPVLFQYAGDVAGARKHYNGSVVVVQEAAVTAVFPDCVYIEQRDRSSGIRVVGPSGLYVGQRVTIEGIMDTQDGERLIRSATASPAYPPIYIRPLGISNRNIGGGSLGTMDPGVDDATGLFNVGLLVTTWGKVTYAGPGEFYIDDGSQLDDGSGHHGLMVDASALNSVPSVGTQVTVTGISAVRMSDSRVVRKLRPRNQQDVVVR